MQLLWLPYVMRSEERLGPEEAAARVQAFFDTLDRTVFDGDPATNSNLLVEVVEAQPIDGGAVVVVIAPWTISAILFLGDETIGETIVINGRRVPVLVNEVSPLGRYHSVTLVRELGSLTSQDQARETVAASMAPFLAAVADATTIGSVEDPSRRDLLRSLAKGTESRPV